VNWVLAEFTATKSVNESITFLVFLGLNTEVNRQLLRNQTYTRHLNVQGVQNGPSITCPYEQVLYSYTGSCAWCCMKPPAMRQFRMCCLQTCRSSFNCSCAGPKLCRIIMNMHCAAQRITLHPHTTCFTTDHNYHKAYSCSKLQEQNAARSNQQSPRLTSRTQAMALAAHASACNF